MLTEQEIQKIVDAHKVVFATKQDFLEFKDEIKKDVVTLTVTVDGNAKKADMYFQEMLMLSHKIDRHERWLLQISDKLGLKLEY